LAEAKAWAEKPMDLSKRAVAARTEASSSTIEIAGAFATRPHFFSACRYKAAPGLVAFFTIYGASLARRTILRFRKRPAARGCEPPTINGSRDAQNGNCDFMIRGDARSRYGTRVPTAKSNFKLHRSTFGPMVPRRFRGQSEYVTDACARNSRKDCFSHSPISDNTIRITGMYAVQKTEKNMSYPIHMSVEADDQEHWAAGASAGRIVERRPSHGLRIQIRAQCTTEVAASWIAGRAWSKAVAVTVRRTLRGRCGLSERGAGSERDQRDRGDKGFHDASPFVRTIVRKVLQQRRADGQCSAVSEEMAPRGQRINHYLGFDGRSNWLARSYLGLDVGQLCNLW
jgi:hypothetical protein